MAQLKEMESETTRPLIAEVHRLNDRIDVLTTELYVAHEALKETKKHD